MELPSKKSKTTALLLCFFIGGYGAHRFYTGYKLLGFLYMFSLGLFGFGWLIDLYKIANNTFKDSNGRIVGT